MFTIDVGSEKFFTNKDFFNDKAFSLSILRCVHEYCNKNKLPEERVRPYHSLHFILNGRGTLRFDDKEYKLKKGECFLVFASKRYTYFPDKSDPWSYIWIDFECDEAEELFSKCNLLPQKPFIEVKNWDAVYSKLLSMLNSFESPNVHSMYCAGYFLILLAQLIENYTKHEGTYTGKDPRKFKMVRDAIVYMNNNYRMTPTLNNIADNAGLSPTYLIKIFGEELGISPMQYLTRFKIANACALFQKGGRNITEVSALVGFADPLYFSRCFRSIMGTSPKQYIKSNADDDPFRYFKERNIDYR